ncbi:hypothetical protein [Leptolyngbya sp. FACHB-16]|uniref:hypothetical protein n=1 Tax=unclassified Leptolyngbya TaxID=2650499 RepID=UPI0016863933|nr:hypothetical protein [Leptolyngbya sp. FACHB-16]MBD1912293.1 hypothetical protein [Leptolyngbya sp. FACHB-8]MBD2153862.1 hypothetical protein [Leptolyngbya sp. FACHB-16]
MIPVNLAPKQRGFRTESSDLIGLNGPFIGRIENFYKGSFYCKAVMPWRMAESFRDRHYQVRFP